MTDYKYIRVLPGYRALTPKGVECVEEVLAGVPVRSVGENSLLSMSGGYSNPKYRHQKEYESRGCEKTFILTSILDPNVVDIFPQPTKLKVVRHDRAGRQRLGEYVPDYLSCNVDRFAFVECKNLEKLKANADSMQDWEGCEERGWRYLPGEKSAAELGMDFHTYYPEKHTKAYLVNLQIIAQIPADDLLGKNPGVLNRIKLLLQKRPHTLEELCCAYDAVTGAFIYQGIMRNEFYGLLNHQQFDKDFLIFATMEEVKGHEAQIRQMSGCDNGVSGPLHLRLLRCSQSELELTYSAKTRYKERREANLPKNATDYRDEVMLRQAKEEGAPELAAFVRRVGDRGGEGNRLPEDVRQRIADHAENYLRNKGVPKLSKIRGDLTVDFEADASYLPSPETQRRIILEKLAPEKIAFLSGGKRAFHAARPMTDGRDANPRIHVQGLIAHIDGVYGDALTRPDEEAMYLRPIFYPLIAESGKVLGCGVKIARPSSIAILMALRDCYLRNGYLPSEIVHDWGSENVNRVVREATAHFGCGYAQRPVGAPRFGALVESFNASFSSFLQTLPGGMYFDKCGRSADGNKKARETAAMYLEQYIRDAFHWMFEIWQNLPIGASKKTPNENHEQSLIIHPYAVKEVKDDALARYKTSYPLKGKNFNYQRGFRFGGVRYASRDMPALLSRGEKPTGPRLDCMDPSMIHVMTKNGPTTLYSLETSRIQGLDVAQRLNEQKSILTYSTSARDNQDKRNAEEARLRRDSEKVAAAIAGATMGNGCPDQTNEFDDCPDFTQAMETTLPTLGRISGAGK